jgi:GNAT superfamily N-acetyltransferase
MELRPAREDELEGLTRLFVRARKAMDYVPPVPDEHVGLIVDRIREQEEVWLAEEGGRVVGFLGIERSTNLGGVAVIEKLYVEPGEQGRGIGAALLDKAKELRPEGLALWVFQKNTGARRFYERHGFVLVKLTDGAGNMEHEPDALYAWPSLEPVRAAEARGSSGR